MPDPDIIITPADHPSLDDGVADLLAELRAEPRFFGPSARSGPKPSASLVEGLRRQGGFRLAAVGCDRVVGVVRVDQDGDVLIAVHRGRRGRGIGTALLAAATHRAADDGWTRLVIRTSHRGSAIKRAAGHVGAIAVDLGRGRVDLILPVGDVAARTPA